MNGTGKVLIIDDDKNICTIYKISLELAGFTVETANNGPDGLKAASANKPDVILLDIVMPEMNGLEVLEKIKLEPELSDIPVVVLTNMNEQIKKAVEKGACEAVVKGEVTPDAITQTVKHVLSLD